MWDFRTGQNTVLTRSQADKIGIKLPAGAVGVRLKIEPVYPIRAGGSLIFASGFDHHSLPELFYRTGW